MTCMEDGLEAAASDGDRQQNNCGFKVIVRLLGEREEGREGREAWVE